MRRHLSIICLGLCLPLILGLFLLPGAHAARAQQVEKAISAPSPVLEVRLQEKPGDGKRSVALDPFYLIEDEASRVRVRRVDLALEFAQPELVKQADLQASRLRGALYDFLVAQERDHPGLGKKEQEKVLAGIVNRCLGQDAVTAVKVDQSILLLR